MLAHVFSHWVYILLWGFIGTCGISLVQEGCQGLGFSRMSFPFLTGAFFTGNRRMAEAIGFVIYIFGGWLFAIFYGLVFESLHAANFWIGGVIGLLQGLFNLAVLLPLLPSFHPRMASPYDGPEASRRIEPPGFFALNYGERTPFIHIVGQIVFGIIVGLAYPL